MDVSLLDGRGSKRKAEVDASGALMTLQRPLPPFGGSQVMRIFRQHLTDDGLVTDGTNQDMRVAGTSAAPIDFYVQAKQETELYIRRMDFLIADGSASNNKFGNLAALTNGCKIFYEDERGEVVIHDAITTNFELVRLCAGQPAFGATTNTFRASNISGSAEGYFPQLFLTDTFGFAWGVRLAVGTKQKLVFRVQDDLSSGMDQMDVIVYGFERYPD